MAAAMIYDTLRLAEQLEHEAGFDAPRARAIARILAENAGGNLATLEDLLVTKGELGAAILATREDLLVTKGELEAAMRATREDLLVTKGELEAAIQATRQDLLVTKGELEVAIQATRQDLLVTKGELEVAIQGVSSLLDAKIGGLRGDIRVLYWMTGTTLAGVATLLGTAITIALHVAHLG